MESDYIDSGNTFLFYFGASQYTCEKARWDFNTSICFSMCCLIWSMAPWLHFEWIDASLNVFLLLCTVSHSSYFNGYVKTFPKRISLLFKFQIVSLENGSNNFPFPVFLLADCSYVSAVLTTRWFFSLQSNSIFFSTCTTVFLSLTPMGWHNFCILVIQISLYLYGWTSEKNWTGIHILASESSWFHYIIKISRKTDHSEFGHRD